MLAAIYGLGDLLKNNPKVFRIISKQPIRFKNIDDIDVEHF